MTKTRDKLEEATYFLEQMKGVQSQFGTQQPDYVTQRSYFRYNLNAFLSAFRSITDGVIEAEYKNARDSAGHPFQPWFKREERQLLTNNDFAFLVRARNVTSHEEPLMPRAHFNVRIVEVGAVGPTPAPPNYKPSVQYFFQDFDMTKGPRRKRGKAAIALPKAPQQDVVTSCEAELNRLKTFVVSCESIFTI
jgi:hypothetical protein